ncbi:hypothetical protein [Flavobacterium limi]|uniref:Uncharacterized protein n=1 Tax=Flavobacterium limi TaxID=2045105 RepID=A0ABQ1UK89_9FLAO|nr:hypothetical protein [Flavobacterium limi]GGF19058.1 hypothetical protein GCM10011518_30580 [Flavobacterium limi]
MKKLALVLCLSLFISGMFAGTREEKEKEKQQNGEEMYYGCTTTVWYKNYGVSKKISFYHDDCSSTSCCQVFLKQDVELLKMLLREYTAIDSEEILLPLAEKE